MLHSLKLVVASNSMETQHNNAEVTKWQEYRDALYRFVLSRVSDETAAEDIVQEVLLKAYVRQGTLREPSRLRAWLYQITRNEVIDYYRSRKPPGPVPDELIQEGAWEENHGAQRELARCLVPLLEEVPEPYRQALTLADFEGTRQREIASRMGLSLSGAKSRVQRGRRMLRDVLLKCCRVELDRRGGAVDYQVGEGCSGCSEPSGT
jgi:RNA polymerase sigma-70 factor (ECF subfamily)